MILENFGVRIVGEKLGEYDLVRVGATDRECVSNDGALRLAIEAQNLAQIMNKTGEDEPAGMAAFRIASAVWTC